MPLANRPPNLFIKPKTKKKKKKKRKREKEARQILVRFRPESGGVSLELLFEEYFGGKKNQKWSRATHVTTVPSVNGSLTDRVPTLRNFETLREYIVNF
jgi:hypothetical protein